MVKWIIENKDWVVPLSVALLSLIGATLGGWWSGRKRIGIEVLSKNRQEWINDLRKKMASFILLSQNVPIQLVKASHNEQNKTSKNPQDISNTLMEEFHSGVNKMKEIQFYVVLLLNPNETKPKELIKLMDDIIKDMTSIWQKLTPSSESSSHYVDDGKPAIEIYNDLVHSKIPNLSKETSCILKEEWERVKKGV
ncbi:hypothetical protein [Gilliamella sp. wkB171]|uniref:hypothetical protein n=1 Tax=Gilliamella sp. wkB171 TaxID=3120258 RepID=UPI0008137711|nr:hypothetical protein [Gilliamella apicola]OCL28408.1 hypothetical protein A9G03_01945 [Gilliamella apicola]